MDKPDKTTLPHRPSESAGVEWFSWIKYANELETENAKLNAKYERLSEFAQAVVSMNDNNLVAGWGRQMGFAIENLRAVLKQLGVK